MSAAARRIAGGRGDVKRPAGPRGTAWCCSVARTCVCRRDRAYALTLRSMVRVCGAAFALTMLLGLPAADAKRQRRLAPASLNCTKRVGCDACVADELCLWCVSPRRCLDAGHSAEQLHESCPIQPPVPVCVDMNLAREREGFIRPCGRSIGGSLGREDMPMPDACCGDGVCDTVQAEQAATWTNLEWSAEQAIALSEDEQNCPADCLRNEGAADAEAAKSSGQMSVPKKLIDTLDSSTTVFGTLQEIVHDTYHCEDSYDQDKDGDVTSACSPKSQAQ